MFSQKSTPGSTPGLSTAGSTQEQDPSVPTESTADLMASDFTYSFLKGLDTISPFRPRTVEISRKELDAMANMERQYWEIKMAHFDVVIFFKKGKFYELYDCDAVIGNKEFGLKMVSDTTNRGKMRMAGVPEQSFSEWARLFVFRGYKIGRVEQMNPDDGDGDDDEGNASPAAKKPASKVKIVPRDLVQIITSGTVSDPSMISNHDALFVLALVPTAREVKKVFTTTNMGADADADDNPTTATNILTTYQVGIDAMAVDVSRNIVLACPSYAEEDMAADVATAHLLDLVQGLFLRLNPREVIVPADADVMFSSIKGTTAVKEAAKKFALTMNSQYNTEGSHTYLTEVPATVPPTTNKTVKEEPRHHPSLSDLLAKLQKMAKNGFAASTVSGENSATYEELNAETLTKYQRAQLKQQQAALEKGGGAGGMAVASSGEVADSAATVAARNPNAITPSSAILGAYFGYLRLTNLDLSDAIPYRGHCGGEDVQSQMSLTSHAASSSVNGLSPLTEERRHDHGVFLDAAAIENIELVANLRDGSSKHSIYNHLCRCTTASGKRMFRSWLLRPLGTAQCIRRRQEAVQTGLLNGNLYALWGEMGGHTGTAIGKKRAREATASQLLATSSSGDASSLSNFRPKHLFSMDLERQLSRLSQLKNENTRISYVDPLLQYNANLDLILTSIEVFTELQRFAELATSTFNASVVGGEGSAMPPLLKELIDRLRLVKEPLAKVTSAFDVKKATRDRQVKPEPGMIAAYDDAVAKLKELDEQFKDVLTSYFTKVFGTEDIHYVDLGKDLFLLEVPLKAYEAVEKSLPVGAYTERARTTRVVKVIAKGLEEHIENFKKYTTIKANGLVMVLRHLAGLLCESFPFFFDAVNAFSYIDCLMSLVTIHQQSSVSGGGVCFPTIVEPSASNGEGSSSSGGGSFIKANDLYHLMIPQPVSNDVDMSPFHHGSNDSEGGSSSGGGRVLLLTGPNMGGKSTMMRTIALAFLMGQLGGCVAASSCALCPVTRIFTRIGARDAQHRGQSTLFVELKEMAEICHHADNYSLCLVDELGRGTSTHDGYAIAHATLRYLAGGNNGGSGSVGARKPLVVFSTHYHALAIDVAQQQAGAANATEKNTNSSTDANPTTNLNTFDHCDIQLAYMDFDLQQAKGGGREGSSAAAANSTDGLLSAPSNENSVVSVSKLMGFNSDAAGDQNENSNSVMSVGGGGGGKRGGVVQKITFLYKMVSGICHRSYGVEVAAVAGIPSSILKVAQQQSRQLAMATTRHQVMSMIQQLVKAKPGDRDALLAAARKASVIIAATKST